MWVTFLQMKLRTFWKDVKRGSNLAKINFVKNMVIIFNNDKNAQGNYVANVTLQIFVEMECKVHLHEKGI